MVKEKKRKTKWNTTYIHIMKQGVFYYRNNIMNSVLIEKKLGIPPRTLRRYVAFSRDHESKFYLEETESEKMIKEAYSMSYEELMKIQMEHEMGIKIDILDPNLLDII
jgi:hypothetical protein